MSVLRPLLVSLVVHVAAIIHTKTLEEPGVRRATRAPAQSLQAKEAVVDSSGQVVRRKNASQTRDPVRRSGKDYSTARANSACSDTANWNNGNGQSCSAYVNSGWCLNHLASSNSGASYNYPENNCCECGKGLKKKNDGVRKSPDTFRANSMLAGTVEAVKFKEPMDDCLAVAQPHQADKDADDATAHAFFAAQVQENKCKDRIRVGGPSDGGYIMCGDDAPTNAGKLTAVLSLGIAGGDAWGNDASKRYKVPVFQFDCFEQKKPFCDSPYGCHFFTTCIEAPSKIGEAIKNNPGKDFITMDRAVTLAELETQKPGGEMILKSDIEGSEWKVFEEMPEDILTRFQQIVGEWHAPSDAKKLSDLAPSLVRLQKFFHPIHTHPNDCCKPTVVAGKYCYMHIYEAVYLRRQGLEDAPTYNAMKLPLEIDEPNGGPFQYHLNMWPFNPDVP